MSTEDKILALVSVGRLFRLPSLITGDETVRTMYVSEEIYYDVAGPFADNRDGERHAEFRQTLDAFIEGAEFSVAEDPYTKPSDAMLARVAPVTAEIWDIRVVVPIPGIRVLALTWDYRENLDDPGRWNEETERCIRVWQELFGTTEPFKGDSLHDYLTGFLPV